MADPGHSDPLWDRELDDLPARERASPISGPGERLGPSSRTIGPHQLGSEPAGIGQRFRESKIYAILWGILLPLIGLLQGTLSYTSDGSTVGWIQVFIGLEVMTLGLWLCWGERFGAGSGVIAGLLFAGAFAAAGMGVILLPLIPAMGLGLLPWLTVDAYLYQCFRALRVAESRLDRRSLAGSMWLGTMLALGLPILGQCCLPWGLRAIHSLVAARP